MDTNKNNYTFVFAAALVLIIAVVLSVTALVLKEPQDKNLEQEKMQSILKTIGVTATRPESPELYNKYIKAQLGLDKDGEQLEEGSAVFNLNLATERKKSADKQIYPVYVAEKDSVKYYIIPLHGDGLWNAIWGYIALEDDLNTIYGVTFDHKSETAGLGAEIAHESFQEQFKGKKIFEDGEVEFRVQKGGAATLAEAQQTYAVDAISGGTLTSDGVTNMIRERMMHYLPYAALVANKAAEVIPATKLTPATPAQQQAPATDNAASKADALRIRKTLTSQTAPVSDGNTTTENTQTTLAKDSTNM